MSKELNLYSKIEDKKISTSKVLQSSFGIVFEKLKEEDYILVENVRQKETLVIQKLEKYLDKDLEKISPTPYLVPNKINSKRDNILLARQYIKENTYYLMKFESPNITLPTVKYYLENPNILEERNFDRDITINLANGWRYMLSFDEFKSTEDFLNINAIVAKDQALDFGHLRDGNVSISNTSYIPPIPTKESIEAIFEEFNNGVNIYNSAARLLFKLIKAQPFYDGNKRCAFLIVNRMLIDRAKGLVVVRDEHFDQFSKVLKDYYDDESSLDKAIDFTVSNCFYNTKDKKFKK